ncbi:MAG: thioredoxin domain-containing protein [Gammaproteobacteria bacterium]
MHDAAHTNELIHETSPYLRQHAHNPVDWHAWNAETLAAARAANQPILLSIGYSACHWCHVMAHESFEDPDTAALMNRLFVNIKVDREERPDLDRVYQLAHQVLTQRGGGWPLTVFLAPHDLTPFFAGTYFPRAPRYGMPAFQEVLTRVAAFYRDHQDKLQAQNRRLQEIFRQIQNDTSKNTVTALNAAPLQAARSELARNFDARYGGFGPAPKFPHPAGLEILLRQAADPHSPVADAAHSRHMLETTLTHMADGGFNDQLGGGIYRYSTDAQWMIPHFEKMLYDNGLLLAAYAQAAALTGNARYADVARQTADWALREMQSPAGGFYSSLDADSEGQEGKYYVWDQHEVQARLTPEEFAAFAPRYGLDQTPNFGSAWHLHIQTAVAETARQLGLTAAETEARLDSAQHKLLAVRQQRVRPGLDDKVLTAWNGLMIRGLAISSRVLQEPRYAESAKRALDFIRTQLWRDGRLFATWRDGQAKLPAYLDDYAFLLTAALELLQTHWDGATLEFARELADALLTYFEDAERGGFWFTASDQEVPLYRAKTFNDESLPAGNAFAARALLTLGHLCAEPRYLDAAERALQAASPTLARNPGACAAMLLALEDALDPPQMVVLRGANPILAEWRDRLGEHFDPRRILLAIPASALDLTGLLAQCTVHGAICAYVCKGTQCSLPVTQLEELAASLPASR